MFEKWQGVPHHLQLGEVVNKILTFIGGPPFAGVPLCRCHSDHVIWRLGEG